MTHALPAPARDERGFILVGVVMFMIALTILGLSLFALSSYEAQFFYASQSREQSLQSSESGMELVKALLSDPGLPSSSRYRLEAAQLAVGQFGITRALAYQARSSDPNDTTSLGPVNWDSTLVIVVSARAGGEERTVQSRFAPLATKNPYQQLISCGQQLTYSTSQDFHNLRLCGAVWQPVQSWTDTAWTAHVDWTQGRPIDPSAPPLPLGDAFTGRNLPGNQVYDTSYDDSNAPYWIRFSDPTASSPPTLYHSPPSPQLDSDEQVEPLLSYYQDYDFFCEETLELRVHGTVVWLVNRGACFHRRVTVVADGALDPDNPNVLIIVAKPNLRDVAHPARGLWFQGGLANDSTTTKVFLVSDGDISLTQDFNSHEDLDAQAVSIVAGGNVELMGPNSDGSLKVAHAASMNALADALLAGGWLPATTSGMGKTFTYAQHSWLETRLP
jgi:hypothetical protein